MSTRRHFIQYTTASGLAIGAFPALAAAWPSQPLKIVVPFAPGGTSDVISRLITKPLSDALGVAVVVENKTGAAGMVGAAAVANATDGHTMLLSDLGSLARRFRPTTSRNWWHCRSAPSSMSPRPAAVHPTTWGWSTSR
jgi:tripartite-type tricarboxylate transporter receptor subunit TctC